MSQEVHNWISNKYEVVYFNTLSYFFTHPIPELYRNISQVQKEFYDVNQRIVLVDDVLGRQKEKTDFFNYLYKLLSHLNITNCFVLLIGDDEQPLRLAVNTELDDTTIEFEYYSVKTKDLDSTTNYLIPDTVCINPWINLAIFEDGRVSTCCLIEDGSEENIIDKRLLEITSSDKNRRLRQQFLQGLKPKECTQCWANENASKASKRINDQYVFRQHYYKVDWNNTANTTPISLDIKLKNTCNLSCRICSPRFSSRWYDEMNKHKEVYREFTQFKNIQIEWNNEKDNELWQDLIAISSQVKYITFSGGEPLLDKAHVKLLQYFIDNNLSKEISLHYNTNGTIYADKLIGVWDSFKSVELSFSIDNVGTKFEYERYGAKWTDVLEVLDQYVNLNPVKYHLNINNTVSVLNILDLYDLYLFSLNKNLNLSFNMLHQPQALNIVNLNAEQKQYINAKLMSIEDKQFTESVKPVLQYLNTEGHTVDNDYIINYLQKTDSVRNQDFKKIYPQLASMLNTQ